MEEARDVLRLRHELDTRIGTMPGRALKMLPKAPPRLGKSAEGEGSRLERSELPMDEPRRLSSLEPCRC